VLPRTGQQRGGTGSGIWLRFVGGDEGCVDALIAGDQSHDGTGGTDVTQAGAVSIAIIDQVLGVGAVVVALVSIPVRKRREVACN
jgi:multisubunit Na+/H+ antiporter MnhB subunit